MLVRVIFIATLCAVAYCQSTQSLDELLADIFSDTSSTTPSIIENEPVIPVQIPDENGVVVSFVQLINQFFNFQQIFHPHMYNYNVISEMPRR